MLRKVLKQEPALLNKQARFGGHMSGLEETPSRLKTSWRDDVSLLTREHLSIPSEELEEGVGA